MRQIEPGKRLLSDFLSLGAWCLLASTAFFVPVDPAVAGLSAVAAIGCGWFLIRRSAASRPGILRLLDDGRLELADRHGQRRIVRLSRSTRLLGRTLRIAWTGDTRTWRAGGRLWLTPFDVPDVCLRRFLVELRCSAGLQDM